MGIDRIVLKTNLNWAGSGFHFMDGSFGQSRDGNWINAQQYNLSKYISLKLGENIKYNVTELYTYNYIGIE